MSLVWINGQLVDKSEAKISVFDHGFLYGDGVWEHFRAFNGKLFRPEKTLARFFDTLRRYLGIENGPDPNELRKAIDETLRSNNRIDGYVRIIVTRGAGTLGPDPRKLDAQVIIIAEEYQPFPAELYEHGLELGFAQINYNELTPAHGWNTLGPLFLVQAKQAALRHGCLDAVIVSGTEVISGGEGGLFVVSDNRIRCTVNGTAEEVYDAISEIAVASGIDFHWANPISLEQIFAADEVFLSGITCGVIAVIGIDGKPIGTGREGPITKRIREAYRKLTRGEA